MAAKRKAEEVSVEGELDTSNHAHILPLGAGSEVGRSCIIFKYQDKTVMFDCGIHPAFKGMDSLPLLDEIDIATVDVALITHFHLDHCAAVPYLLRKTRFKGRIFMTHPTKAIYYSLLRDLAKGAKHSSEEALFNEDDLEASMERIEVVDFYQTIEVAGMQITPYRAGHVLGAAMFMVEVAGLRCLYTGDYSRLPDRHLPAADIPPVAPHIVIVESTYGTSRHLPRQQREQLLLDTIRNALSRGGRVLMPVVALGRAQELLLMLDEYWEAHKSELGGIPIYQIEHKPDRSVRLQGRLGEKPPREGAVVRGVLVRQAGGFGQQLLHPDDLPAYSRLLKGRVSQRQALSVDVPFSVIRLALEVMFEGVEGAGTLPVASLQGADGKAGEVLGVVVGDTVTVRYVPADDTAGVDSHVVLEWEGGRHGDMVADAVIAVVLQAVGEPPAATSAEAAMLRARAAGDEAAAAVAELHLLAALLQSQYGPAAVDETAGVVSLTVDGAAVVVDHRGGKVLCAEAGLRARIEKSLDRLATAIRPVAVDRPHE
ncbi:hypothetical protein GPECTOR_400g230 [Gonium pectorale]|uniref:Metallo-beta-lactamase domain-containing protein n=1 Tax=Gonium pectorale TaxID=33097 RepID=A0A150FVC0_GONPE|nr:hypothetical protein GPECTOR_400g230 [Gonium pectorale]|eukprot:KXZ41549.1 hypothetical protein GPECTOR_400g230 [Gonium pectorale]